MGQSKAEGKEKQQLFNKYSSKCLRKSIYFVTLYKIRKAVTERGWYLLWNVNVIRYLKCQVIVAEGSSALYQLSASLHLHSSKCYCLKIQIYIYRIRQTTCSSGVTSGGHTSSTSVELVLNVITHPAQASCSLHPIIKEVYWQDVILSIKWWGKWKRMIMTRKRRIWKLIVKIVKKKKKSQTL